VSSLNWNEIGKAFDELAGKNPGERTAFLDEIRRDSPNLAEELLSLLRAHDSAEGFIENRVQRILNSMVPPVELKPGEKILHFEIVELLGAGSTAQVYLARDTELGRLIALKVTLSRNKEASTLARFSIDGIVQVHSEHWVERDGVSLRLLCIQFIAGPTLATVQRDLKSTAARSLTQVLEIFPQRQVALDPAGFKWREQLSKLTIPEAIVLLGIRLADILSHAHDIGVLHLDVKPANILIDPYGRPFLSDFNVSTHTTRLSQGDVQGMGGTPHYMPPEQARFFETQSAEDAAKLDARSDVYALGVVLRDLLDAAGFADARLNQILSQALLKDKAGRTASAAALSEQLCVWLRGHLAVKEMPPLAPGLKWILKFPMLALVGLTVISQLVASAINITYNRMQIVSRLTAEQYASFMDCVSFYNSITYPLTLVAGLWLLKPLLTEHDDAQARTTALKVPLILMAAISIGWLPGAYLFPLMIDLTAGPLPEIIYWQFAGSFGLAWLISLTTSMSLSTFVLARSLYPKYWHGQAGLAASELRFAERLNRLLAFASALIPMSGVLLVVLLQQYAAADADSFKILLLALLSFGLINLMLVQRLTQYVDKCFQVLKKPRSFG